MPQKIRVRRYTKPAMVLHWVAAIGIFTLFAHGFWMVRLPDGERAGVLDWHRSIGIAVLLCVLLRIWWRATHPPPRSTRMPKWQDDLAHFIHIWLYVLVVANGISGVLGWIFSGDPIVVFGLPVTALAAPDAAVRRVCHILGFATSRALAVTIGLHVAAALKHQFVDRDRLLARMWVSFTRIDYNFDASRDLRHRDRQAATAKARHAAARRADRAAKQARPSFARQVVLWERDGYANAQGDPSSPAAARGQLGIMEEHARTIQGLRNRFASFAGNAVASGANPMALCS